MSTLNSSIINVTPSRRKFASTKDNEFYVAVKLTAPKISLTQRQPIAISVALDVSGSMNGGTGVPFPEGVSNPYRGGMLYGAQGRDMSKLDVAKFALLKLVENLTDQDTFSLVSFSDYTTIVVGPTLMTTRERPGVIAAIKSMQTRGSTALSAGLYEAINLLRTSGVSKPGSAQRAMLFTDGAANMGDVAIEAIEAGLRHRFRNELPGITTFGIGTDYNGELLGGLARGGGAHYYIDSAERLPTAFGNELGTLASLYAKNVELTIRPAEKVQIVEVLNNLQTEIRGGDTSQAMRTIACDDLYSEQTYNVVFLVKVPKRRAIKALPILTVEGKLRDIITGGTLSFSERLEIGLGSVKDADKLDNAEVMSAVALQLAARSQREAMEAAKRGDLAGARRTLQTSADVMKGMGRADLGTVNTDLITRGYSSQAVYTNEGSKLSSSLGNSYSRQTAGMGGTKVGGVDVDAFLSNSSQRQMANAFSITKGASVDDQMPNVDSMVTSR